MNWIDRLNALHEDEWRDAEAKPGECLECGAPTEAYGPFDSTGPYCLKHWGPTPAEAAVDADADAPIRIPITPKETRRIIWAARAVVTGMVLAFVSVVVAAVAIAVVAVQWAVAALGF